MLLVDEKQKNNLNTINNITTSKNWEFTVSKEYFTGDEVIEAYLQGKKAGLKDMQKLILTTLSRNVNDTGKYISEIIGYMKKEGFSPKTAYLKIESWNFLKVLITISEEEFISKKFLEIYDYVSNYENKINNDLFKLEISFVDSNGVDINCIYSDGFLLKHKSSVS